MEPNPVPAVLEKDPPPNRSSTVLAAPPKHPRRFAILFDLLDVDADGHTNQRHFASHRDRTNVCCLDLAWTPLNISSSGFLGVSANLGTRSQDLSDSTTVSLTDGLLGAALGYATPGGGPWGRIDAGISSLVVTRRTTGVDWGLGWALRAGWAFHFPGYAILAGGGVDGRKYLDLNVREIQAATFFLGVML